MPKAGESTQLKFGNENASSNLASEMEKIMTDNDKADIRKITGTVEDAVAYPILTRDVTSPASSGTTVPGPSGGASLDSIAEGSIRQLLGWRYRADDTTGFIAALTKTIQLKEVEDHIEWDIQPQNYTVQADLGQVTGAQKSIYARAQVALDQSLPLLNGLTLLGVPTAAGPPSNNAVRSANVSRFQRTQTFATSIPRPARNNRLPIATGTARDKPRSL
jgi:hypothetical protein